MWHHLSSRGGNATTRSIMLCAAIAAVGGCSAHRAAPPAQQDTVVAPTTMQSGQQAFATPETAVAALADATQANNEEGLIQILGPGEDDVVRSGDPVADKNARDWFAAAYSQKHELVSNGNGSVTLSLGNDEWPLPIPLVRQPNGSWSFDTAAGHDEILNRRIGRNELAAMQVCRAIVDAQQEYAMADADHDGVPAYAERFSSHPQKKDGLYWPTDASEKPSPLGALFADASDEGYSTTQTAIGPRRPYHGYFYRILKSQGPAAIGGARDYRVGEHMIGGFGVVAWPADYGNSGVMTFIVNQEGIIYQRNLGDHTEDVARAMTVFDPTSDWEKCEPAAK